MLVYKELKHVHGEPAFVQNGRGGAHQQLTRAYRELDRIHTELNGRQQDPTCNWKDLPSV